MRPYGIKVNKRKERKERYDKEEDEEEEQPKFEQKQKQKERVKRAKREVTSKAEEEDDEEHEIAEEAAADELDVGIPIVVSDGKKDQTGVIFVLEKASLEVAKVGKVIARVFSVERYSL